METRRVLQCLAGLRPALGEVGLTWAWVMAVRGGFHIPADARVAAAMLSVFGDPPMGHLSPLSAVTYQRIHEIQRGAEEADSPLHVRWG